MFDMSWGEVMVIGGVALIVIGPKDLPRALRTVGQMTTKVRRLATEFQGQFNEAMREAELDDVRREVADLNRQVSSATSNAFNPIQTIRDELKSAVEKPAPVAVPYEPTHISSLDESAPAAPEPVEEAGPIHHIEPMPEPASPAAVELQPVQDPTEPAGPGLEGDGELAPPRSSAIA